MPFNQRSTALAAAVLAFFTVGIVAAACRNCPFTCCKRALAAMVAAYVFTAVVIKIINAVVLNAMVSKYVDKITQRTKGRGHSDGSPR
jgi:hypothetical protein